MEAPLVYGIVVNKTQSLATWVTPSIHGDRYPFVSDLQEGMGAFDVMGTHKKSHL
jgi:hypothetical protein